MYRFAYRQTTDQELAKDLTQEIFIKMLQTIHHYDNRKASFRTWLYRLATNRIIDYYRSKQYRQSQLTEQGENDWMSVETGLTEHLERKEILEQFNEELKKLDATSQQIIRLKLFAGYTFSEIAENGNYSISTIKTRYYTAIRGIRKVLEDLL